MTKFDAWFAENQKHLDALGDLLGTCEGVNPLPLAVKQLTLVERLEAERDRLRAALEAAEDFLTTLWNELMVDNNPPAVAEGEPERVVPVEQALGIIRAALEPAPEDE